MLGLDGYVPARNPSRVRGLLLRPGRSPRCLLRTGRHPRRARPSDGRVQPLAPGHVQHSGACVGPLAPGRPSPRPALRALAPGSMPARCAGAGADPADANKHLGRLRAGPACFNVPVWWERACMCGSFAQSLAPLPLARSWLFQGVLTGVSTAMGYGWVRDWPDWAGIFAAALVGVGPVQSAGCTTEGPPGGRRGRSPVRLGRDQCCS